MIFSAYRRDDFADADGFAVQLGMVLERFEDCVIHAVTDPITGVQRKYKFPPSIAEIVDACEAEATRVATVRRYQRMPRPERLLLEAPPKRQGHRANVFVSASAPQYPAMVERAQKNADPLDFKYEKNGISVPITWLLDRPMSDPFSNAMVARMAEGISPPAAC